MPTYLKTGELDTRWCTCVTCPHCGWEDCDSWEYDQDYVEGGYVWEFRLRQRI
jgi:hypothetical protein